MPHRFFASTLLFLLQISLSAQETKHITQQFTNSKQVSKSYYVLKSNKNILHGAFVAYFPVPKKHYKTIRNIPDSLEHYVWQRGAYENGNKHGEWVEYSAPGVLHSKGVYDRNKKTGLWLTSKGHGEVLEKYDHTTRQKQMPEIRIGINYPPKARKAGIEGEVRIQYQLQQDCSISDLQVLQSLSAECDAEATQKLLKYYRFLKTYGPPNACEAKTDTFKVQFRLE